MWFRPAQTGPNDLARLRGGLPVAFAAAAIGLLVGCVDFTPPWERSHDRDSGLPAGSGGELAPADANGAGGAGGGGGPIEGWPTTDVPIDGEMDGAGLGQDVSTSEILDTGISAPDGPTADAADGLAGAEADGADDASLANEDGESADVEMDAPMVGSGGAGGSFLDAPPEGAPGGGGSGGATSGTGGTSGFDGGGAEDGGAGSSASGTGGSGTGGSGTGGSGTGGSGTGGSGTGGSETGGSETGGSGTGGSGTGGSETGGSGTGASSGSGGSGGYACTGYQGRDAGSGITEGLIAWYGCDSADGTELPDNSSNGHPGTLHAGYSFGPGARPGNALYLTASQQGYVTLPAGLAERLARACEVTIAAWVWVETSQNWQRIFDFGSGEQVYMFLTPGYSSAGLPRFAISVGGNQEAEQRLDSTVPISTGSWHHLAVVLGPSGGVLYLDAIQVASNPAMTLRPGDLGNPSNLYIGRSQFAADPYFDGRIDSFRIYDRSLSAAEITDVFNY